MVRVSGIDAERHLNSGFSLGSSALFDDDTTPHPGHPMPIKFLTASLPAWLLLCWLMATSPRAHAQATTPAQLQQAYQAAAGSPAQAARGQAFFVSRHGGEWSCASCHNTVPTSAGRHAITGKSLAPLAPAFNPQAFTDQRQVEKWFRRNCQDVVQRECSPAEKADVLAWLRSLR